MTPADLRTARAALGLTQRGLASALGVPQNTVARWETGRFRIQHGGVLALALRALRHQFGDREPADQEAELGVELVHDDENKRGD